MHSDTAHALLRSTGTVVVDQGSGPVVALAHGAGGGVMENFTPLLDRMTPDRRLVGPYWPGAGGTPRRTEPLQLDELADAVVAAAVAAGADRFAVVGVSLGAAVAVTAALRHPEHVSSLVLTVGLASADTQVRLAVDVWRFLAAAGDLDALAGFLLHAGASATTLEAMTAAEERAARDGIV